ncbi:hypothetical protein KI387_025962, partial [Taxus chinensis]
CNCGPCRKLQGLEKTGIIVHHARGAGFSNAHDYLVFQSTGESPYEIACRKKGHGWCKSADHFLLRPEEFETQYSSSPMASTSQLVTNSEVSHASENVRTSITSLSSEDRLQHGCNNLSQNKRLKTDGDLSFIIPSSQGHEFAYEEKPTPGARVVGCRIDDTAIEKTCHRCRKKSPRDHIHCSRCPCHFCDLCLMNRHGEDIVLEMQEGSAWVCPRCRKGCGPGCMNCCNCSHCRKEQGLEVTGQIVQKAKSAGFTNVHDYLVFKTTHESPHEISRRKLGRGWCRSAEYVLSKPEEIQLHSQRSPLIYTGHQQTLTTNERMRGSLTEEQVKQLSKSYLAECYNTEQKPIKLSHECRELCHEDIMGSRIADSATNSSCLNNPPLSGSIHSSGITSSKLVFQHQTPIAYQSETTKLSNREGNDWLSYSQPVVIMDSSLIGSGNVVKVEAQPAVNIDSSSLGVGKLAKVEAKPAVNIDSSPLGSENTVKIEAQTLHTAFSRDATDSIWTKNKDFEVPLAVQSNGEKFQSEIYGTGIKVESDADDDDYKFFTDNVKLDGPCYVLNFMQDGSTTSVKYEDPSSNCMNYVNKEKQICISEEKKKCKSMASESKNRKKRLLACTGEINHAHVNLLSSELPVEKRQSYLQDYTQQKVKTEVPSPESSSPSDVTTVRNIECSEIPLSIQSDDFKENLEATLQKPYNTQEFHELWTLINNRKPIVRFRHTRQGTISVETQEEGFSYLDYHPDLSDRLASAISPEDKLTLLRGFFFWLMHASWPRAFQPWASSHSRKSKTDDDDSDCVEVDGPESEAQAIPTQAEESTHLQPCHHAPEKHTVTTQRQSYQVQAGSNPSTKDEGRRSNYVSSSATALVSVEETLAADVK